MNLTGGLHWHWRAWRAGSRWTPTRTEIESWLLSQPVHTEGLIVIGASAGWMMSSLWLSRFKWIETWDIDPLAAPLFQWRHGNALRQRNVPLHCHTGDGLAQLPMLLRENPEASIFFDNVLGQLRFQSDTVHEVEKRIDTITQVLRGRHWGSVHDRMSGPVAALPLPASRTSTAGESTQAQETQNWLSQMGAQSPWLDHLTGSVFSEDTKITHIAWPLQATYWHWLQAGWVTP